MRTRARLAAVVLLALAIPSAADPAFDPKPWLADLDQMKAAFASKYANLEWAEFDHGADLNDYFGRARKRITNAEDAGSARAAFDGLIRRLGDGHVEIEWPAPAAKQGAGAHSACADAGYDPGKSAAPLAALAPGYQPLKSLPAPEFPAGIIAFGTHRLGVLKIGLFSPQGTPSLCEAAIAALSIPESAPCDDACSDRIDKWAHARMTSDFIAQLHALEAAHIYALLIDVAGNGGGTEWAEAAARMVSGLRLNSERMDFVRGPQWTKEFAAAEARLREAAKGAVPPDRDLLLRLADAAEEKRAIAATPCDSAPLWQSDHPACSWLGRGFYASGMIASAEPARLRGKLWASTVFTPMEYPYVEGAWRGPLIVLVDGNTWSAAEEFAAVLQDNRAGVILGEPTGGAGCGHTDGSAPEVLSNSRGKLELPDCARIRADGSNEVRGVGPDVWAGWRRFDGAVLRAHALALSLPQAIARAEVLSTGFKKG
jgi:hypothetical protein